MKTLKQQVTCLKLSQEMKELGYKQEGLWWWRGIEDLNNTIWNIEHWNGNPEFEEWIVAPTAEELLSVFPDCELFKLDNEYSCFYIHSRMRSNKATDALAEMWIYSKKQKLI